MAKNIFNSVKMTKPGVNQFDLTHDVKLSCNMGELIPTLVQECVPGDKFKLGCDSLVRLAPMVAPVMHRIDISMHYFFVPYRLLWDNWENFITATKVGPEVPAFPVIGISESNYTPIEDYLGLPVPVVGVGTYQASAMAHAAYQCVYNEYYRDQNLVAEVDYRLTDGALNNSNPDLRVLRRRAWEHDYFTACLPFAQKGEAVDIPIGSIKEPVPVLVNDSASFPYTVLDGTPSDVSVNSAPNGFTPVGQLYADTQGAVVEATTINDLRRAYKLQEWLEKNARGGTRYTENIRAHFGVQSSDKRLQRPEYITGVKSPVTISEVLNTTGDTLPQGNMAGHGVGVTFGNMGSYYCEEHGIIIGIMSVMPKTAYQQGIPRFFMKYNDMTDYYWPSFANLGEQAVKLGEIWAEPATVHETFGFVPRYAEYKFNPNRVAGDFKTTLDYWHMGRKFSTQPNLNQTFIECDPTHRIFAVTDPNEDKLYCQVLHKITAIRPMPKYGTPTF